jgi:Fe2+ or Zn2+ uptake regulation protein
MTRDESQRAILRNAGLRVTQGRLNLVAALRKAAEPVSLEDAVRLCRRRGGDPATVYRNLQALKDAGLLRVVRGVGRREMFELTREAGHGHAHLSCTSCGRVECVDLAQEPKVPRTPAGWSVKEISLTAWGLCPQCA